jgi:hypothetical protein
MGELSSTFISMLGDALSRVTGLGEFLPIGQFLGDFISGPKFWAALFDELSNR